jgi:hypothetical protein
VVVKPDFANPLGTMMTQSIMVGIQRRRERAGIHVTAGTRKRNVVDLVAADSI